MYRSPQYQSWLKQAGLSYLAQRPALSCKSITGPYNLRLVLYPPDRRLRDTDNFGLKPINDFLQAMGIVANDRLQRDIHVSPRQPDGEARVEVIVTGVSSSSESA